MMWISYIDDMSKSFSSSFKPDSYSPSLKTEFLITRLPFVYSLLQSCLPSGLGLLPTSLKLFTLQLEQFNLSKVLVLATLKMQLSNSKETGKDDSKKSPSTSTIQFLNTIFNLNCISGSTFMSGETLPSLIKWTPSKGAI